MPSRPRSGLMADICTRRPRPTGPLTRTCFDGPAPHRRRHRHRQPERRRLQDHHSRPPRRRARRGRTRLPDPRPRPPRGRHQAPGRPRPRLRWDPRTVNLRGGPRRTGRHRRPAKGVHLVPARPELAGFDARLSRFIDRTRLLDRPLDRARRDYDFIFLDTPPTAAAITTVAAYGSADWFLLTALPHPLALAGLSEALKDIAGARPSQSAARGPGRRPGLRRHPHPARRPGPRPDRARVARPRIRHPGHAGHGPAQVLRAGQDVVQCRGIRPTQSSRAVPQAGRRGGVPGAEPRRLPGLGIATGQKPTVGSVRVSRTRRATQGSDQIAAFLCSKLR